MSRFAIVIILAAALWFGLKDWTYRTFIHPLPEQTGAVDYNIPAAWRAYPAEPPAGGWVSPWGVDVFVLSPRTGTPELDGEFVWEDDGGLAETLRLSVGEAQLYAPKSPYSEDKTDTGAAPLNVIFEQYLRDANRKRGVYIAVFDEDFDRAAALAKIINADDALQPLFGGVIVIGEKPADPGLSCAAGQGEACLVSVDGEMKTQWVRMLTPNLGSTPKAFAFSDEPAAAARLAESVEAHSAWMEEHLPKPAEPLGGFDSMEAVDVAPIRRPGDTEAEAETGAAPE